MAAFLGLPVDADDILRMTGFELLDLVFESEKVRVLPASMGEFTGQVRCTVASRRRCWVSAA